MNNHEEKMIKYANDQDEEQYKETEKKIEKKSSKILPAKNINNSKSSKCAVSGQRSIGRNVRINQKS